MTQATIVAAGDVRITARDPVRDAAQRVLGRLWIDKVPVRLASGDPTLWGFSDGTVQCWPGTPAVTRALLPEISELTGWARAAGLTDVVLLGRGAPAAAARVIADHVMAPLTVLDGLDAAPSLRLGADPERLRRTLAVVTGDDMVAKAQLGIFWRLFQNLGLDDDALAERFIVVTEGGLERGSVLSHSGRNVPAGPRGEVFGALSPYALVPAALAGVNVTEILDQATAILPSLTRPDNNPGLALGAILGGCARLARDKVIIADYRSRFEHLGDWAALLLSGATGTARADARFTGGLVPVVQHGGLPLFPAADLFLLALDGRPHQDDATISGSLGAQFVVWEYAAAVAAYLLGADPFAVRPLADPQPALEPPVEPAEALQSLLGAVPEDGYLAIFAYLDPDPIHGQGRLVRRLAAALAVRGRRPVVVRWNPCPPAKDDADKGVYLVLTGKVTDDEPVLDGGDQLSWLQLAQAITITQALRGRGRPVVRLHLHNRWTGIAQLLDAAQGGRA